VNISASNSLGCYHKYVAKDNYIILFNLNLSISLAEDQSAFKVEFYPLMLQ
jgi:hypothetical protein